MPSSVQEPDPSEHLADQVRQELARLETEASEIQLLIRGNADEAETMAERDSRLTERVQQMDTALETYSRQDIRDAYRAALEARMRLYMLRSQIEGHQARQEMIRRQAEILSRVMDVLDPSAVSRIATPSGETGTAAPHPEAYPVARVIEAQENERKWLARQMHDGPAQALTNLILQAEICEKSFDSDVERARSELAALKQAVTSTFRSVREFIFDLRPMMLDDLGLVPTLRRYLHEMGNKADRRVNFTLLGPEQRLPSYGEVTLFRLIQEGVRNALEHAGASQVQVTLDLQQEPAAATIDDDGPAIDPDEAMTSASSPRAVGLRAIRDQAAILGCEMLIQGEPGRGTRLVFRLPWQ